MKGLIGLLLTATALAQGPLFEEVPIVDAAATSRPIPRPLHIPDAKGGGVSLADLDGDGRLDLIATRPSSVEAVAAGRPGPPPLILRGKGDATFENPAAVVPPLEWAFASAVLDLDGDGLRDIVWSTARGLVVWRQSKPFVFDDESSLRLPETARRAGWCTSLAVDDLDLDGDLDLVAARYLDFPWEKPPADGVDGRRCRFKGRPVVCGPRGFAPMPILVLERRGGGFVDGAPLLRAPTSPAVYGLGVVTLDANDDARPDIAVAADMTPNLLFLSTPSGTWEERGERCGIAWSADGAPEAGMGIDAGDLDGDGRDDLVITNFEGETNAVLLQERSGLFREASVGIGTAAVDRPRLGWGVGIRDFNLDGRLDIFVANGHVYADAAENGSSYAMPLTLHLSGVNDGRLRFTADTTTPALARPRIARAAAFGDLDADGRLDAVVARLEGPPVVLRNTVRDVAWFGVTLKGPIGNRDAIGARIRVATDRGAVRRRVGVSGSFLAQSAAACVFPFSSVSPPRVTVEFLGKSVAVPVKPGVYVDVDLSAP